MPHEGAPEETDMADAIAEFFAELEARGYEPLLRRGTGTIRFDLHEDGTTDRWLITVTRGNVVVRREEGDAECVVAADRSLFVKIVSGRANAMAAVLRGAVTVEGDSALLTQFQRLFPGPPAEHVRTKPARRRG